jgi:hypothetical protein
MADYEINYDDERFAQVESDKNDAIAELENTYDGMIDESDSYFQAQIDASKEWADKQSQIQQEQTDFAVEKIEQQKDQTHKDYIKEQSGAYTDWQKQSNQYGADAESKAAGGMANTGYSESAQVSMYNAYQNRVAVARESYNRAILNYDNAIQEAILQNNSVLAEIAYNALQEQLELSLQGFQYKNQLLLEKADKKTQMENEYYQRYQDVLAQINTENALAEEIRQYNESLAEEKRQFNESIALDREQFEWQKAKASSGGGGGGGNKSSSSGKSISKGNGSKSIGKNSDSSEKSSMKSILDLGYGPISEENLANKVASGQVKMYEKNGTTLFENNTNTFGGNRTSGAGATVPTAKQYWKRFG